jgi:hypothetical protein
MIAFGARQYYQAGTVALKAHVATPRNLGVRFRLGESARGASSSITRLICVNSCEFVDRFVAQKNTNHETTRNNTNAHYRSAPLTSLVRVNSWIAGLGSIAAPSFLTRARVQSHKDSIYLSELSTLLPRERGGNAVERSCVYEPCDYSFARCIEFGLRLDSDSW